VEGEVNKFDQISGIFSQFSEENKDKLLETAIRLLEVQRSDAVSTEASQNVVKERKEP
jgi:hypothetical protein